MRVTDEILAFDGGDELMGVDGEEFDCFVGGSCENDISCEADCMDGFLVMGLDSLLTRVS